MGSSAEVLHMQGKRDHHLEPMQEGGNPPYAQSDLLMTKTTVIQGGQQCCDFAGCGRHNRHSCLIAEPESENRAIFRRNKCCFWRRATFNAECTMKRSWLLLVVAMLCITAAIAGLNR